MYVADPACGFGLSADAMAGMLGGGAATADPDRLAAIRADLPILVFSGDADPLAGGGSLVELVAQRYRDAGVADVTVTLYPARARDVERDEPQRGHGRPRRLARPGPRHADVSRRRVGRRRVGRVAISRGRSCRRARRTPDEAGSPSASSAVTVSVENTDGVTPAHSMTSRPSLNVPIDTSTPSALRSHAS